MNISAIKQEMRAIGVAAHQVNTWFFLNCTKIMQDRFIKLVHAKAWHLHHNQGYSLN
jgi:hypothetical protein